MSVTSSTDPVQTIVDILDDASSSDWANGGSIPDRIERTENSDPSDKARSQRLSDISLYVFSPADGDLSKFSADDDAIQTETAQVDIYTDDSDTTNNYASDVISITGGYSSDNEQETAWTDIWPTTPVDNTGQAFYYGGFAVISVQIRLQRHFDP